VFQNIQTGELRQEPSDRTTLVDLNAPNLTRTVCPPLSVPTAAQPSYSPPGPGSLLFYGSLVLTVGTYAANTPDGEDTEVYLERCGEHLHRLVLRASEPVPEGNLLPGANTREVVWMSPSLHPRPFLGALTLPGLRRFTIRLPKRFIGGGCSPPWYTSCVSEIALTERRLYLLTAPSSNRPQLWAAPIPLPAKPRHR
jgi:hypothetical protein